MNALTDQIIIRAKDFQKITGIPDSTRADWENPASPRYNSEFPKKIKLGKRTTGYFKEDINNWLASYRSE